jgi:hypothetical protein
MVVAGIAEVRTSAKFILPRTQTTIKLRLVKGICEIAERTMERSSVGVESLGLPTKKTKGMLRRGLSGLRIGYIAEVADRFLEHRPHQQSFAGTAALMSVPQQVGADPYHSSAPMLLLGNQWLTTNRGKHLEAVAAWKR